MSKFKLFLMLGQLNCTIEIGRSRMHSKVDVVYGQVAVDKSCLSRITNCSMSVILEFLLLVLKNRINGDHL